VAALADRRDRPTARALAMLTGAAALAAYLTAGGDQPVGGMFALSRKTLVGS
jgi:hypothetical protein